MMDFFKGAARWVRYIWRYILFINDFILFKKQDTTDNRFLLVWSNRYPCLNDKTSLTGFDRHYIYHPAWAARVLAKKRPSEHVDIGSTLHFCTLVSAFVPVRFYDYRPAEIELNNLASESADLLDLPFEDNSIDSLSCMHVVEHVGLGRYGDPIDPLGDVKAMQELQRVLSVKGVLLFVVPVGKPKIMFNAHRVYSYEQIVGHFSSLNLVEFSLVPEHQNDGGMKYNATADDVAKEEYACGCFWFTKI